jgi:5-methylcytosine-specific restriction endonuclease McrA
MTSFSHTTRAEILERDAYGCVVCGTNEMLQVHHYVPNTKLNSKLYGKLIQSAENGVLVCFKHHANHTLWDKPMKQKLLEKWSGK